MREKGIMAYRKTDVITSDPKRLVVMCYQGVIDNLKAAQKKCLEKEFEGKAKAVAKAQDFLNELMHALDFEQGGEIARNLDSLYNYMSRRIIYAEANRTMEPIEEVIGLIEELKGAWEEAFFGGKKKLPHTTEAVAYVPEKSETKGNPAEHSQRTG